MAFVNIKDVTWSDKLVGGSWPVKVPSFMDIHGWFPVWEVERFRSMENALRPGKVLYDIGAYDGWQDAILSSFVGAQNMVLVEPEPTNWPNIRHTWEANTLEAPGATFMGLIGTQETEGTVFFRQYPEGPDYSQLISHTTFRHLDENLHNTACLSLDSLVKKTGMIPDAINVDVEGAGLVVLQSGEETLRHYRPLVWVSIHPGLTRETLGQLPAEEGVHEFMKNLGYREQFLAVDHEEHWLFV